VLAEGISSLAGL